MYLDGKSDDGDSDTEQGWWTVGYEWHVTRDPLYLPIQVNTLATFHRGCLGSFWFKGCVLHHEPTALPVIQDRLRWKNIEPIDWQVRSVNQLSLIDDEV